MTIFMYPFDLRSDKMLLVEKVLSFILYGAAQACRDFLLNCTNNVLILFILFFDLLSIGNVWDRDPLLERNLLSKASSFH
ncbi:hypothetical protein FGIG_11849 [Fasciola gigantica]|uniref:Uncharacterized protein n=1 Tax=Fasciola gigantica TaxID=46835 RepID=A0A504Y8N5_FASGI|nr:hypothetical protein FGIG_11849 [Fasciola gigantica]